MLTHTHTSKILNFLSQRWECGYFFTEFNPNKQSQQRVCTIHHSHTIWSRTHTYTHPNGAEFNPNMHSQQHVCTIHHSHTIWSRTHTYTHPNGAEFNPNKHSGQRVCTIHHSHTIWSCTHTYTHPNGAEFNPNKRSHQRVCTIHQSHTIWSRAHTYTHLKDIEFSLPKMGMSISLLNSTPTSIRSSVFAPFTIHTQSGPIHTHTHTQTELNSTPTCIHSSVFAPFTIHTQSGPILTHTHTSKTLNILSQGWECGHFVTESNPNKHSRQRVCTIHHSHTIWSRAHTYTHFKDIEFSLPRMGMWPFLH
nr:PREDICTED: uncharacterized protein LOC103281164 [Anolis carolinensis]|eukprot:XP_008120373.1 PREDICTED: uncharacterized protein LOC103281164 [Anolis carolinensis]